MEHILRFFRRLIPKKIFRALQPMYHYILALLGAVIYRFPSQHIKLVGITGTKGKTTTTELVNVVLEKAGYKTAVISTLRFKAGEDSRRNLFKMTMPGRFFIQRFLRHAAEEGCDWVVLEMTSEGTKQFRHKFLELDALIFTNLSPEHIESHGSYEKYVEAKLQIADVLAESKKESRVLIANGDDKESEKFLARNIPEKLTYTLESAKTLSTNDKSSTFTYKRTQFDLPIPGVFNVQNALAAITFAESQNIDLEVCAEALKNFSGVRGRAEFVNEGQPFDIVVDYAHTPDSLKNIYGAFYKTRICVLGGTGGGRDGWKRKEMGRIAAGYCSHIILTDEDPYDEDPRAIVDDISKGIDKEPYEVIMDRRDAIHRALELATAQDVVLITGKGTDPYIMGPRGTKVPWDDATVVREELAKMPTKTTH